jgi:hypothetical protein
MAPPYTPGQNLLAAKNWVVKLGKVGVAGAQVRDGTGEMDPLQIEGPG